jgi:hypothetical protein
MAMRRIRSDSGIGIHTVKMRRQQRTGHGLEGFGSKRLTNVCNFLDMKPEVGNRL